MIHDVIIKIIIEDKSGECQNVFIPKHFIDNFSNEELEIEKCAEYIKTFIINNLTNLK